MCFSEFLNSDSICMKRIQHRGNTWWWFSMKKGLEIRTFLWETHSAPTPAEHGYRQREERTELIGSCRAAEMQVSFHNQKYNHSDPHILISSPGPNRTVVVPSIHVYLQLNEAWGTVQRQMLDKFVSWLFLHSCLTEKKWMIMVYSLFPHSLTVGGKNAPSPCHSLSPE